MTGMMEQYDFIFGSTSYAGMPIIGRAYDYGQGFLWYRKTKYKCTVWLWHVIQKLGF